MPPMAEAAGQVTDLWQLGGALLGIGGVSGGNIWAFVRMRTQLVEIRTLVNLYRDENQKDHTSIGKKLDDLNGTSKTNTKAIGERAVICEERHRK